MASATGYVHEMLDKNQTFQQFTLSCARAFGALIEMRDDPMDAPVPDEFKPSTHYASAHAAALKRVADLAAMGEGQRLAFAEGEKRRVVDMYLKMEAEDREQAAKCEAMAARVRAWKPPTADHQGLKDFMLKQLETSSSDPAYWKAELEKARSRTDYYESAVSSAARDVQYYAQQNEDEIRRARERSAWVQKLKKSIAGAK